MIIRVIQNQETLQDIAIEYNVSVESIMAVNGIINDLLVSPGLALRIKTDYGSIYESWCKNDGE